MKHNTNYSRECLSQPKHEINLDDSNNYGDTISHDNTISHDDTCSLKYDFNSYQVKCVKELQNIKNAFPKNLSNIEQNIKRNFNKKTRWERWETSKSTEKRKLVFERWNQKER